MKVVQMKAIQAYLAMVLVLTATAACDASRPATLPAMGQAQRHVSAVPVCPGSRLAMAQCDLLRRTDVAMIRETAKPPGYAPADLRAAYNIEKFVSSNGSGQIVAIVDAYDNPNVSSDLAKYRSTFHLPSAKFFKYNEEGDQGNYPEGNENWGAEIDLDVEMVSVSCPKCTIYLVEANSDYWSDLETAEAQAVTLGAHIVSNSYRGSGADQSYYDTPGVTYLASSGDSGYGIADPADFGSVVAVGGTSLYRTRGAKRGWSEVVWSDTGAGCSSDAKPKWQHDPGCADRTANDVSAVADPATGPAMYDTYGYGGWFEVGGTSVSSPLLAGIFGLAGDATKQNGGRTFWMKPHEKSDDLYPITSGSDRGFGSNCSPTYLCTAGTGEYRTYSGPGGWGSPNGIAAF
jgi:subtilase family serine protease